MITVTHTFTFEDAKKLFESVGLEVKFCKSEIDFKNEKQNLDTWVVINPYTQKSEPLDIVFSRYVCSKNSDLHVDIDKLRIFNLFKKT